MVRRVAVWPGRFELARRHGLADDGELDEFYPLDVGAQHVGATSFRYNTLPEQLTHVNSTTRELSSASNSTSIAFAPAAPISNTRSRRWRAPGTLADGFVRSRLATSSTSSRRRRTT